jgi:hypothetical protein
MSKKELGEFEPSAVFRVCCHYHLSLQSGSSCDLAVRPDGLTAGMRPGFISFLAWFREVIDQDSRWCLAWGPCGAVIGSKENLGWGRSCHSYYLHRTGCLGGYGNWQERKVVRMRWKCEAPVHAMKAWEELEESSHAHFGITWGEWSASRFGRLTPGDDPSVRCE